jgi:hypothetical protein
MKLAQALAAWLANVWRLLCGVVVFWRTGKTPEFARRSMVELFSRSNGWTNDAIHFWVSRLKPPLALGPARGVLGDLTPEDVAALADDLRHRGYRVFPGVVPPEVCGRLLRLGETVRCTPWYFPPPQPEPAPYDRSRIIAPTYWAVEEELVNDATYQELMCDPSLLAVAQAYLGTAPVLGTCAMWWSPVFNRTACDPSAQLYHFDCAHTKWLKLFIYLTETTAGHGPHCFVAHSHRPSRTTAELLKLGQKRIPDEVIARHFPADDILEFTGPAGTIILEDTRGFHKGKVPLTGERLMMELEFCNSLFGATEATPTIRLSPGPLAEAAARYPRIYRRFQFRHEAAGGPPRRQPQAA